MESRIIFKILLLVYKSLNNLAPAYINRLLKNYKPSRNLRSVDQGLLTVPKSNQWTYGDRAFSVAAAKLWNSLPLDIRNSGSITLFKRKLKTFLFKKDNLLFFFYKIFNCRIVKHHRAASVYGAI